MIIKKVYISNFKGIKNKTILDFSDKTSLLVGPNGFGKTTIFDAIELAFTGKIHRTDILKVTKDNKNYKKPFFQNDENKDVIIKVWLENEDQEQLVIVKFFDKDYYRKNQVTERKNKPSDFSIFKTYMEDPKKFDNDEYSSENSKVIEGKEIEKFLKISDNLFNVEKIYKLFNYLQQEETTYFLKQSEENRKRSLGFLFQTSKQENELKNISEAITKLDSIYESLDKKIASYKTAESYKKEEYYKLIKGNDIEFDQETLFGNEGIVDLEVKYKKYTDEINKIIDFKQNFSPKEYQKRNKLNYIENVLKQENLLNYVALKNYINENTMSLLDKEYRYLNNKQYVKSFILEKYFNKVSYLEKEKVQYNLYQDYIKHLEHDAYNEDTKKIQEICNKIFPEKTKSLLEKLDELLLIQKMVQVNDNSLQKILENRNTIHYEYHQTPELNDKGMCPYCGKSWESTELDQKFIETESIISDLMNIQSRRAMELKNQIKKAYIDPMLSIIKEKSENLTLIDDEVLATIKQIANAKLNIDHMYKLTEGFRFDDNINILELDSNGLNLICNKVKNYIESKTLVSRDLYDVITKLNTISFSEELKFIKKYLDDLDLNDFSLQIDSNQQKSLLDLKSVTRSFDQKLTQSKERFKFSHEKVIDLEGIYDFYFDNNSHRFEEVTIDQITKKKRYIHNQYKWKLNKKVSRIEERMDVIQSMLVEFGKFKKVYGDEITSYKKEMIERIKFPFYLYTAKILQNYQQGFGIFLSTLKKDDSIRFITDPTTDHDAMHHLSSGQIAVISLAFTLAINKTYNISNNLKFLVIDDPIQDMDSLNIHSFIELLKYEFSREYQIILSTHKDFSAMYTKYKFERLEGNGVKVINVQNLLHKSIEMSDD